jgi:putative tricarboxylic transport membrane protein
VRFKPRSLFSLLLMAVAAYAAFTARRWSFKTALFPLVTSIPLFLLAGTQFMLELFRGDQEAASGPAVELELTDDIEPRIARKRIVGILIWIAGFIALVFLVGFPIAVPVFIFSYLSLQSGVGWWLTFSLTAIAWLCFYGLFQWMLNLPFEEGFIQTLMGI